MTTKEPAPTNAPLGLPDGSVRAMLAFLIVLGGLGMIFAHRISFDQMLAFTGPAVGLYFGQYISTPGART